MPRIQIPAHCRNMRTFRTAASRPWDDGIVGKAMPEINVAVSAVAARKFHISNLILSSRHYFIALLHSAISARRGIYETISWSK